MIDDEMELYIASSKWASLLLHQIHEIFASLMFCTLFDREFQMHRTHHKTTFPSYILHDGNAPEVNLCKPPNVFRSLRAHCPARLFLSRIPWPNPAESKVILARCRFIPPFNQPRHPFRLTASSSRHFRQTATARHCSHHPSSTNPPGRQPCQSCPSGSRRAVPSPSP